MQFLHRDFEQSVDPGFSKGLLSAALILFAVILAAGYPDVAPLSIAISKFITESGRDWSSIMALNVIATLPLICRLSSYSGG